VFTQNHVRATYYYDVDNIFYGFPSARSSLIFRSSKSPTTFLCVFRANNNHSLGHWIGFRLFASRPRPRTIACGTQYNLSTSQYPAIPIRCVFLRNFLNCSTSRHWNATFCVIGNAFQRRTLHWRGRELTAGLSRRETGGRRVRGTCFPRRLSTRVPF